MEILYVQEIKDSKQNQNQITIFARVASLTKIEVNFSNLPTMSTKTSSTSISHVIIVVVNLFGDFDFSA